MNTREKRTHGPGDARNVWNVTESFYLLDFAKMPVAKSQAAAQAAAGELDCSLKVVKNRLGSEGASGRLSWRDRRSIFRARRPSLSRMKNPIGLARLIREFSTQHKMLKVKAGMVEGGYLHKDKFDGDRCL